MELDGVSLLGVCRLPAVVSVDIITWVVSVGPFTVQCNERISNFLFHTYIYYMLQVESKPYVRAVPILTEFTYSKCLYMYMYSTHWSRTLCTTYVPDVELEVSLLVDGVFLLGVSGLPADVGVDVITWVVSVGPFTVQVYMQSTSNFTSTSTHYMRTIYFEFDTAHADGMHLLCLCIHIAYTEYSVKYYVSLPPSMHCPSGVRHFTAVWRLMLGPLTAHTFTL